MPLILDGIVARNYHIGELRRHIERLSIRPHLVIFQIGNDTRSALYIKEKKRRGGEAGVLVSIVELPDTISMDEIISNIKQKNEDRNVHGIIVQLPLPESIDKKRVISSINPSKDVDGLTPTNTTRLSMGDSKGLIPATAKGIMSLLSFYHIDPKGKKIAVLGRSALVGAPTAQLLTLAGASVTICNSQTENTAEITKNSDIIVVAIGNKNLIDTSYIGTNKPVIIDVGINEVSGEASIGEEVKKITGDVNFAEVAPMVGAITPVPGGVGPMTVVSLLENVFSAACDTLAKH